MCTGTAATRKMHRKRGDFMAGILFEPSRHLAILATPKSKEQSDCPPHLSGLADPILAKINHP
jgi:hypothetical protein